MSAPEADTFVRFVLDKAGEAVRSIVRYDADASTVLYLRDDVPEHYSPLSLETVIASLRRDGEQAERQEHVEPDDG